MCPGTPSRPNWRSTTRPSCCGASRADRTWVRTVSADEIANVFTRHLGFASGLLPENALWWSQGETGQVVALWRPPQVWPVALQREAFQPPARLRLPMPGLVFLCSPARAPWVYAALERPTDPAAAALPRPRLQRLPGRADLPRQPPLPRGGGAGYPNPSSSPFSPLPETPGTGRRSTPTTCKPYGRNSMDKLTTRLRTWFPNAPWAASWRPAKGDGATTNPAPAPVGYLVNHPAGLAGSQGIGFDYVLGSGGLYVQSESAHLTARVLVAPAQVRGLAPVSEKLELGPRPHTGPRLRAGPGLDAGRAGHRAVLRHPLGRGRLPAGGARPQEGTGSSLSYQPPAGVIAEFHSHASHRAFFSATDDRDEQGFRDLRRRGTPGHPHARIGPAPRHLRPLRARCTGPRCSTGCCRRACGWRRRWGRIEHQGLLIPIRR